MGVRNSASGASITVEDVRKEVKHSLNLYPYSKHDDGEDY